MEIEAGVQERYRDSSLRGTDLTHFFLLLCLLLDRLHWG